MENNLSRVEMYREHSQEHLRLVDCKQVGEIGIFHLLQMTAAMGALQRVFIKLSIISAA
jgi:hypothetical protein